MAMFNLDQPIEVWWPVEIHAPADGGPRTIKIDVKYRIMNKDDAEKLRVDYEGRDREQMRERQEEIEREFTSRILDWRRVGEHFAVGGEPLTFTPENLKLAMAWNWFESALLKGLENASRGALAKN